MSDQFGGGAKSPMSGQNQQDQSGLSSLTGKLKEDMRSATRTVSDDLSGLKDNIAGAGQDDAVSSLKEQAKSALSEQTEKAKTYADQQKSFLAQQVSGIGQAIRNAADNLEQSKQPTLAGHARTFAQSLDGWSESMKNQDIGDIFRSAQDFGRRQPAALIGIAALAGFAASRFLMSSKSGNRQGGRTSMGAGRYNSSSDLFGDDDDATMGSSFGGTGGSTSGGGSFGGTGGSASGSSSFGGTGGSTSGGSSFGQSGSSGGGTGGATGGVGSTSASRRPGQRSDDLGTSVLGGEV